MRERREKIIRIDPRVLVNVFNGETQILGDAVPADARVLGVWPNHSCRALDVLVSHPSFDVVPDGAECPAEYCDLKHLGIRCDYVALPLGCGDRSDRGLCRDDGGEASTWRDRPSML